MYSHNYDYETDTDIDYGKDFGEEADEAWKESNEK